MFGQQFKQLRLQAKPNKAMYKLTLTSPKVSGQLDIPSDFSQGVVAEFEKLVLQEFAETSDLMAFKIKAPLPINVSVKQLTYKQQDYGDVKLNLVLQGQAVDFHNISVSNKDFQLQAKGLWQRGDKPHAKFEGVAESPDLARTLSRFGIPAVIEADLSQLGFNLQWPGNIAEFSLAKATGSFGLNVERGRIPDLGQDTEAKLGIGKLVNLLSLQTLPRRLHFDFSDLTQSGFSFDTLRGDFELKQGMCETKNTVLNGPVATIELAGVIDLPDKYYDLELAVMPHLPAQPIAIIQN